jgi:hypothetical protein
MHTVLKFDILRVPFTQIPTKKDQTLSFVSKLHLRIHLMALLVTILGLKKKEKMLRVLKFDILKVPPIRIPSKKG